MARPKKIFGKKKRRNNKNKRKAKHNKSALGFLFKWTFVLGLWSVIIIGLLCAWYAADLPRVTSSVTFDRQSAITIKAADGSTLARYGEAKGNSLSVYDLPEDLINAVLATEDRRFYSHFGMDPIGLARAMAANLQAGKLVQGGSTITQQLAKNLFLSRERTIKRKAQEAILAFWLEHELTKDEILSAYLNRVYLGSGTYGVEAASQRYFGKSATEMNLKESATIAGLLKAPSRYSPLNNPKLSNARARIVLGAMVDAGYITHEQSQNLTSSARPPKAKPTNIKAGRYYTDWVIDGLEDLIGTPNTDLIVETSLDPKIQDYAEKALVNVLTTNAQSHSLGQGAVLVMRPNGAVVAMVGGKSYAKSQFNRATQAKRAPGSTFKPILYLTALEQGWKTGDILLDEPFDEETYDYRPSNYNDKYHGEVTMQEALVYSLNTPAVRLMAEIKPNPVINTAKRLGIFSPLKSNLSLALGSSATSLLEMTTAYASIANGGFAAYPYAITKISAADGTLYYQRPWKRKTRRIIKKEHTKTLTNMLELAIEQGTGKRARLPYPAAGKTGTSQNNRDAWFIGYTDELVTGVWLGNDNNTPMEGVTGGGFPAIIWKDVMSNSKGLQSATRRSDFTTSSFGALLGRILSPTTKKTPDSSAYNE